MLVHLNVDHKIFQTRINMHVNILTELQILTDF